MDVQWQMQDFPLGDADSLGGTDVRRGHFSAKTCAKTKELDPVGSWGMRLQCTLDPPMIVVRPKIWLCSTRSITLNPWKSMQNPDYCTTNFELFSLY